MHKVDGDTLPPEPTGATYQAKTEHKAAQSAPHNITYPVQVRVHIRSVVSSQRQVVIYDHVDLQNVDTSRDHVCGDQHFEFAIPEVIDHPVAFPCFFGSMQRRDVMSFRHHTCGDLVCSFSPLWQTPSASIDQVDQYTTHLAENDALPDGQQTI